MKDKLKEFMDTVFADAEERAPHNRRLQELKEEMLRNLCDRYDDLVANGKTPAAAYNVAVTGVGDVTELLDSVIAESAAESTAEAEAAAPSRKRTLTPEEAEKVQAYKRRSAILTAVAVSMYILCWLPLVTLSALVGDDVGGTVGLCVMFLMIAGATAMLIYNDQSKPAGYSADDDDDDRSDREDDDDDDGAGRRGRSPAYKVVSALLWLVTLGVYLSVSFATGAWNVTWLIFLIVAALDNVIKAIFDLRK